MKFGTRRNFILHGTAAAVGVLSVNPKTAIAGSDKFTDISDIRDSRVKELVSKAIDSAISSGASYADCRLSHTEIMDAVTDSPWRMERMSFGIRVLVNGSWGFAASPVWNHLEAARLGASAVAQARSNSQTRETILAPLARMESGDWTMPIKDDPFEMSYEEITDFLGSLRKFIMRMKYAKSAGVYARFIRVKKAFGSSLGQYTTQCLYRTSGGVGMGIEDEMGNSYGGGVGTINTAGLGFEYFRDQPLREMLEKVHENALRVLEIPIIPILPGRFETLIDSHAISQLISKTIGRPTEIDTAFGYEANAGGTGFIDPIGELGSYKIGNERLSVFGDRSAPGSVGLVKWDDEGVEPVKFDIVKDGIVVDMQCNREGAGWIGDYLSKKSDGVRSTRTLG